MSIALAIDSSAQTFTTLHSFDVADGAQPYASLIQGTDGNFYGTTSAGGSTGWGTVFKISSSGAFTTLHKFDETDGAYSLANLTQSVNGDLYGTTPEGGAYSGGVIFKITASGAYITVHSFYGRTDGYLPFGALVQATDGNLYGTTGGGGAYGGGTVFKMNPSGTLTTLYSFCPQNQCPDGKFPQAALIEAANGDLYGTTSYGGPNDGGTVFKITPSGTLTTLYNFCAQSGCSDGTHPTAALVQARNGDFYGTTYAGGANAACTSTICGTVFKITPSGTLTTLYSFCAQSQCGDGDFLAGGLLQGTDGNFYGTATFGGTHNGGTIFKITATGAMTTLYNFCSQSTECAEGKYSWAALLQATNGTFYGTTFAGGAGKPKDGTVFSLSVDLGPFVAAEPSFGRVGRAVKILGTSLTGATSVTFNGIPATFTVISSSEITTAVPASAATGNVQVTTPDGTLTSNTKFTVRP